MERTFAGPHLILPPEPGGKARACPLPEGETRIGRAADNDVVLPDRTVSRFHCRLVNQGGVVVVEDGGGSNPVKVGEGPADGRTLEDGDVLRLGKCRLVFRAGGTRPAARRPPAAPQRVSAAEEAATAPRVPLATVVASFAATMVLLVGGLWFFFARGGGTNEADPAAGAEALAPAAAAPAPAATVGEAAAAPDAAPAPPAREEQTALAAGAPSRRTPGDEETPRREEAPAAEETPADDEPPAARETASVAEASLVQRQADGAAAATAAGEGKAGKVPVPATLPSSAGSSADAYFVAHVVPFLTKYCVGCHGEEEQKGDLALHVYREAPAARRDRKVWTEVARKLRAGEMPPPKARKPLPGEASAVVAWIDGSLLGAGGASDPGRVTLRRLNNYEYNYTIRDLVGLDLQLADDFPEDEIGYGFDNIGDVLSLPPLLMEKYLGAAQTIVYEAWADEKARGRILVCQPKAKPQWRTCARQVIERFASRAYRRPPAAGEIESLLKIYDIAAKKEDDFAAGIRLALQAVLVSPHFLFRVELDSRPQDPAAVHPLNDFELASRLSYFIWSSMPDEELFTLARKGELRRGDTIERQARRLLADGKSRGLIKTFSALWLGSRPMKTVSPDAARFPGFDEDLRQAMRKETELFFQEVMANDLSVLLFLDSDFTFLNDRLARHYGIPDVKGDEFRRVTLPDRRRGGVLTQGTVLTVTSNPTRTSPVKRGKWILEQLLGMPPPPPPPGADSLKDEGKPGVELTLRQMMERHRADPNCAVCHEKMDTLGIALENYDGVGAWREKEGGVLIDASGTLPDGRAVRDVQALKDILLSQKGDFVRCLVEKMLTFALGRGLEYTDTATVDRIAGAARESGYRFSTLVVEIVKSEPFQNRRGERMEP